MTVSLSDQIAAVDISAVNLRGHVANLADLVARGRRPQHDYDIAAGRLPALEAAAITLRQISERTA
jgi:hypothetical protein